MVIPEDISVYNKMNSLGMLFFFMVIISIFVIGIDSLVSTDYTHSKEEYNDYLVRKAADPDLPYLAYIALWQGTFGPLMGILGGAFYFHNIALSVVKDSRNPEHNVRDVFIGYVLSCLTYISCGIMGYYGFFGKHFEPKLEELPVDGV